MFRVYGDEGSRWFERCFGLRVNDDGGKGRFALGRGDWPFDSCLVRWLRLCWWSRRSRG